MKKILAILLTIALLMPAAAWACPEAETTVLLVRSETKTTFCDPSYWPVTEDHGLASIKDYQETVQRLSIQRVSGMYISGRMENGWARELRDGMGVSVRIAVCGETVIGLTELNNVTITVYEEFLPLALKIIHALLGDDVELSAAAIVACMTWVECEYASVIFFPSYSDRFVIGTVAFNGGRDVTPLCVGTFGGQMRMGLMCGFREAERPVEWHDVNITAEAEANAVAVANAQASANAAINMSNSGTVDNSGDGCYRNNNIIQINVSVFGAIKNWLGIGNKGGCDE